MRVLMGFGLALALLCVGALAAEPTEEHYRWASAKSKWDALGLISYSFSIEQNCYCMSAQYYGPIKVMVKGGAIESATYEGEPRDGFNRGDSVNEDTNLKTTVDSLFARVENMINGAPSSYYTVTYDPDYGFPNEVKFDDPNSDDEEWSLAVTDFARTDP